MPLLFILLFLFPALVGAQTFSEGRFIAKNNTLLWTERFEIKDMDEPVIAQTVIEQLSATGWVRFDSLQQHEVVYGHLIAPPFPSIVKARFRIDILYERYIVTVCDIIEKTPKGDEMIEKNVLDSKGHFIIHHSPRLDKLDSLLIALFEIKQ